MLEFTSFRTTSNFQHAIKALYADRAYDRHKLYKLCDECGIKTKIPPKKQCSRASKVWQREMLQLD